MQYLFGPKSIKEGIRNHLVKVKNVYVTDQKKDLINHLELNHVDYTIVKKEYFNKWNTTLNHQHCIAEIEVSNIFSDVKEFLNSKWNKHHEETNLIIILDELNDPRNFGAIIRTSYALGVKAIIYKKNNQVQLNELVEKTSLGACHFIPLIKVPNLSNAIQVLKDNGYWTYCSTLSPHSEDFQQVQYDKNVALIIGSESNGASNILQKNADFHIKIPMKNDFDSLNVSVATGILIAKILG